MKNHAALAIPALVIIGIALVLYSNTQHPGPAHEAMTSFLDSTYTIDGVPITLVKGTATTPAAPGSASVITTSNFGTGAIADLNGDGKNDGVFMLTQTGAGSGTFYYVVAAIAADGHYIGTNAVLLGDRIAPQSLEIRDGEIIANYADRPAGAAMTDQPSVGVSKYLKVVGTQLVEATPSAYAEGNLLLGTDSSAKLGTYLIGSSGMTLYASSADTANFSHCTGKCVEAWAPYTITATSSLANTQAGVNGTTSYLKRSDGSLQVTYNGAPLYFSHLDNASGDTNGTSVSGWSVVKP